MLIEWSHFLMGIIGWIVGFLFGAMLIALGKNNLYSHSWSCKECEILVGSSERMFVKEAERTHNEVFHSWTDRN